MEALLEKVSNIATMAGKEILEIYNRDFEVDFKEDGSPLTMADQRAHELIVAELLQVDDSISVLSEESNEDVFTQRLGWHRFWLVDPLDGTKEFVNRNGEFTVNIALIENSSPVLGVVHTPVKGVSHFAAQGVGAFKSTENSKKEKISTRTPDANSIVMVASRSHSGPEVDQFRSNLEKDHGSIEITGMGSSLKICLVAEGAADIYPRLGPTSEWDTAAAHCVLTVAGGNITDVSGKSLSYNKPDILNPWFLASGSDSISWVQYLV